MIMSKTAAEKQRTEAEDVGKKKMGREEEEEESSCSSYKQEEESDALFRRAKSTSNVMSKGGKGRSEVSISAKCGILRSPQKPCDERRRMGLWEFVLVEALGERHSAGLDDSVPKAIDNFLAVPARFERFVAFGLLVSLDTFLDTVTLLPLRAVMAFFAGIARLTQKRNDRDADKRRTVFFLFRMFRGIRFDRARAYDLMRFATLAFCGSMLSLVPMGQAYHWIRGQNTIKLYVIIGIMEVFDRLACAFGQDALDSLYLATRRSKTGREIRRVVLFFVVTNGVVLFHAALLYVHITTLNVVVNASEDSAIVALLVSNNFSEIKSFVFKKYNAHNLFELACSDVCERFKLCLFLALLVILAWSQVAFVATDMKRRKSLRGVALQAVVVAVFEVVADWLKHAFMAKFNKLDAHVYDAYADRLARDVVTGRGGGNLALDHTHAVTRRLGLAVLPLACIAHRYLAIAKNNLKLALKLTNTAVFCIFAALFLIGLELKVLTSVCLAGVSFARDRRLITQKTEKHTQRIKEYDNLDSTKHKTSRASFDDPRFLRSEPKSPTTPNFHAILKHHQEGPVAAHLSLNTIETNSATDDNNIRALRRRNHHHHHNNLGPRSSSSTGNLQQHHHHGPGGDTLLYT